ncbi:MAG: response regulator, partial [Alphaproteobacteria bacterium]|nr:response regulator [Alphaproteobacteria bacterium]
MFLITLHNFYPKQLSMFSFLLSMYGALFFFISPLNAMEDSEEEPLKKVYSSLLSSPKGSKEIDELKLSPTLLHAKRGETFQQVEEDSFFQPLVNSIFKTSPDLVVLISEEGKFLKVNEEWKNLLGWEPKEILSLSYVSFLHPKDQERFKNITKEHLISSEQIYLKNVWKLRCKEDSYREIEWVHIPMECSLGESLENSKTVLLIGKNVTECRGEKKQQKRKIKSLYQSLEQRNKLLQALSDIQSIYIERDLLPQKSNREEEDFPAHYKPLEFILQKFLLLTESEFGFIGELFFDAEGNPFLQQIFAGQDRADINENLRRISEAYQNKGKRLCNFNNILGSVVTTKKPLSVNDLKTYPYPTGIPENHLPINTLLGIPLTFGEDLVGIIALANNPQGYDDKLIQWIDPLTRLTGRIIHELKIEHWRQEAQDQQYARNRAEESNKAKSIFLAHMSHEIRTPLSAILGLLEIIDKDSSPSEMEANINHMRQMAGSLLSIVNDILDISKIEAGQLAVEEVQFNPTPLLNDIIHLFSLEAEKKSIGFTLSASSELPITLVGDSTHIRHILVNLISNAIKFTHKGGVAVTLRSSKGAMEDHISLYGEVKDTGVGMTPNMKEAIFKPFIQGDQSVRRKFGGTGLGLYIVKKLCNLMGGDVEVESEEGKGSAFRFTLNLKTVEKPEAYAKEESQEEELILPSLHILVVEDHPVNQLILNRMLTTEGCDVKIANNGKEAVELTAKNKFDLILMDGEMPVMDGLQATRIIRTKDPDIPIIGITAHAMVT